MKNKNGIIMAFFLASALAAPLSLTTGCITTADGRKIPDPVVLTAIAQDAAYVGATITLKSNPQYRPEFELTRLALEQLIAAGSGSPSDLQAALAKLPIKELQGQNGAILVQQAVVVLNAARAKLAELDKAQVYSGYVQPIAQGLLAGLDQALGVPPSAPAAPPVPRATAVPANLEAPFPK